MRRSKFIQDRDARVAKWVVAAGGDESELGMNCGQE
jgi:hypothetical protein